MSGHEDKIIIVPDEEIADLIPGYIAARREDAVKIAELLAKHDFPAMEILGHRMKGSGAGYGFEGLTDIGAKLETAARNKNSAAAEAGLAQLRDYLSRIEIRNG